MVLKILFLIFSRADIWFAEQEFVLRTYMAAEALLITTRVEIIDKREFAVAALIIDNETFVIYIEGSVEPTSIVIHPSCQA